jgi:Uma2 family endonuclease
VSPTRVSLEEFQTRYASHGPYEYWFGEVVEKSVPTWLHAILQLLLGEIFYEQGYFSGLELDLRISRGFQPRPGVAASLELESEGYPTKPIDIVAEILSPDDTDVKIAQKCRYYANLGIHRIFVFDPVERWAAEWDAQAGELRRISELQLTNNSVVRVDEIFARFEERLKRQPKQ